MIAAPARTTLAAPDAVALIARFAPAHLLLVGAGDGRFACALAHRLGPAARLSITDTDPSRLARLRRRVGPGPALRHAGPERLPYPDALFDVVCAAPGDDSEARRVVRSGGWLVTLRDTDGAAFLQHPPPDPAVTRASLG